MAEKTKKVGEIFSDYNANSNLKYANVMGLNVLKKENKLQIALYYDEYIEIKEIWYFEKYLKERFQFAQIDTIIKYHEAVEIKSIKEEWKNIIAYMAHKYPLMKPMLLLKSDVEVVDNEIDIKMHIRGAEFLKAKKTDKELQKVLKNLFGKEYVINLQEDLSLDDIREIREARKREEEQIIANIEKQNEELRKQKEHEVEYQDSNYMPPVNEEGYIPQEGQEMEGYILQEGELYENPGIMQPQEYIMGKPSKAKEKHIKIKDITANDGRVTLEGRVANCEVRETKSGKGMIICELYDGTGTMTCKSFSKDLAEGKEIVEKIGNAKTIKLIGKAGLDTYAGDVTVIANTIIGTENDEIPELPTEEEMEDTPLILGQSMNITEDLVKIQDLGVDDGKIALQGEVIYTEDKTLKSGKTLFSFDLYDGTSTITCKAFLNKENAKKIMKRIQSAKGIKIAGTAQMDTFSNELTVMANTIVETEGLKKEVRQDKQGGEKICLQRWRVTR